MKQKIAKTITTKAPIPPTTPPTILVHVESHISDFWLLSSLFFFQSDYETKSAGKYDSHGVVYYCVTISTFFLVVFFQFRAVSQLKYGNDLASKTVSKALIEQIEQVSIYLRARMVISGLYCENNQHNEVHLNFRQSILSLRAFPTIFSYFS